MRVNAQGQKEWCVAKPSSSTEELFNNLNYACSIIDCQIISKGGRHYWNCNFGGSGLIAITDPSYGNCIYEFRK
ncbi:unnamed protein product [Arabidopsis lyrata]|nr:unnamed protein product [Arabidopsis lyrata]